MTTSKLETIGRACARHPWRTIAVWLVLLVGAVVLNATLLGSALTTTGRSTDRPDSTRAQQLIEKRVQGSDHVTELVIIRSESRTVDDPIFRSRVAALATGIRGLGTDIVQQVMTFEQVPDPSFISKDRHATIIPVVLAGNSDQAIQHVDKITTQAKAADGKDGYQVLVAGGASIGKDYTTIAEQDAKTGESIGIGVALIILVLVFGAVVAATVPVILAGISVAIALGLAAVIGQAWQLTFTVTNIITMMGLAVGIDYSLFILSRFREERARGRTKLDAIGRAQATAGRAVFFSGITVMVAVTGLFLMPSTVFRSLAAGAVLVVGVAILAALTLLPAALGLLGDRVNALKPSRLVHRFLRRSPVENRAAIEMGAAGAAGEPGRGFWDRVTRMVMGRPVIALVAATLPLLVAAGFYLDLNPGSAGASTLPDRARTKPAFLMLEREFSFGLLSPVQVVVEGDAADPRVKTGIDRLQQAVATDAAFAGPGRVEANRQGDLTMVTLSLTLDPNSEAAENAVRRLRAEHVPTAFADTPAEVLVGGPTAMNVDFFTSIDRYLPWVFAFVLGLSFLLLTMVFRSLVVPLKAIVLNLLSVGAAYGLLVLVFQKGFGAGILGLQRTPRIEAWLPLFLFAILFGLSMDYHVLLLSRIREHYDETGDNTESVAFGLRSTAGLITGAAVIMVAVFGGFAAGDLVMFQQMGFGLAVAVLLDATIVRTILVPASMKLLGKANWWMPRPLRWLPDLRVEPTARLQAIPVREERRS